MERPFVETLAAQLSRCIAKADGQAPRKETRTMGEGGLAVLRAWA
jgi:hypothetical protein